MTEYKMFEGCTIGNRIPFVEAACRKVFEKLGIETSEAPFSCCPDPTGMKSFDNDAWLAVGARNLCLAEEEGKDIISLCNGCANTLCGVDHQLKHDSNLMEKVNSELAKIGKEFKGSVDVKHFVDVLLDKIDGIKGAVENPLSGLKVACHPGCHYMRPAEWMEAEDDVFRPKNLRKLVAATGATAVDYEEEVLCCGSAVSNAYEEHGEQILKKKLDSVKKAGADCLVVNCPACFQQFDTNQRTLSRSFDEDYSVPVLYITELIALAMGIDSKELGMRYHRTRLRNFLADLDL